LGKEKHELHIWTKKWVLVGILAVIIVGGIGAYMFLYPQEEKVSHTVVSPKAPPRVAAPAAASPVSAPVAAPVSAPVAAPVAQPPTAAPKAAAAPAQANAPAAPSPTAAPVAPPHAATPVVAAPVSAPVETPSVAEPVQALQTPLKRSKSLKTAKAKPDRPKDLDLRNCLDLEDDKAIAKCAGE
jgi:hypothetical protein